MHHASHVKKKKKMKVTVGLAKTFILPKFTLSFFLENQKPQLDQVIIWSYMKYDLWMNVLRERPFGVSWSLFLVKRNNIQYKQI